MSVPMEQWDLPKWYFPMMKTLRPTSDIGVLVVEWLLPSILTWYKMKIKSTVLDPDRLFPADAYCLCQTGHLRWPRHRV